MKNKGKKEERRLGLNNRYNVHGPLAIKHFLCDQGSIHTLFMHGVSVYCLDYTKGSVSVLINIHKFKPVSSEVTRKLSSPEISWSHYGWTTKLFQ